MNLNRFFSERFVGTRTQLKQQQQIEDLKKEIQALKNLILKN